MSERLPADLLSAGLDEVRVAKAALDRAVAGLENALEQALQQGFNALPAITAKPSDHRREHRPGRPRIIAADPVLQAFIVSRIDRMTFDEIAADVARHFPPERRVRKSAIHTWWQGYRKRANRIAGQPADHSG
jgi:hypothetical protein